MGCRVLGFGFSSCFWGRTQKQNKKQNEQKDQEKIEAKKNKVKEKKKREKEETGKHHLFDFGQFRLRPISILANFDLPHMVHQRHLDVARVLVDHLEGGEDTPHLSAAVACARELEGVRGFHTPFWTALVFGARPPPPHEDFELYALKEDWQHEAFLSSGIPVLTDGQRALHRASCARAGVLGRRFCALESACFERTGARVTTNVLVRDLDLGAADGLPLFGGARLAVDTTLVSILPCDGSARQVPHTRTEWRWKWQDVARNGFAQSSGRANWLT